MSRWFRFERRWRDELCRAAVPATAGLPGWDDLDVARVWVHFEQVAPAALQRAWRLSVWAITVGPRRPTGWPGRVGRLRADDQEARLAAWRCRPSRLGRQLDEVVRLVVALAYLDDPAVRERALSWSRP